MRTKRQRAGRAEIDAESWLRSFLGVFGASDGLASAASWSVKAITVSRHRLPEPLVFPRPCRAGGERCGAHCTRVGEADWTSPGYAGAPSWCAR